MKHTVLFLILEIERSVAKILNFWTSFMKNVQYKKKIANFFLFWFTYIYYANYSRGICLVCDLPQKYLACTGCSQHNLKIFLIKMWFNLYYLYGFNIWWWVYNNKRNWKCLPFCSIHILVYNFWVWHSLLNVGKYRFIETTSHK